MKNPYEVLGVPKDATDDVIKSAFRKLALQYHPDRNQGDKAAEEMFKEINNAYETLKDPVKRAAFDMGPSMAHQRQHHQGFRDFPGGHGGFSFEDIFHAFNAQRRQRNNDIIVNCMITLEEAFTGKEVDLAVTTSQGVRYVSVKIPPGAENGTPLRVSGAGERIYSNFPPGDLYVKVRVAHHDVFARVAQNLLRDFEIDALDAMLGTEADIQTIDGQTVRVTVPPGVQNGQRLRIAGHGMPVMGQMNLRGDLLLNVSIVVPDKLTDEQKDLIRQAKNLRSN